MGRKATNTNKTITPEQLKALEVLTRNINKKQQLTYEKLTEANIKTGFVGFVDKNFNKNLIPKGAHWMWNQSNARIEHKLEDFNVVLFKLNPRGLADSPSGIKHPSYKLWVYQISIQKYATTNDHTSPQSLPSNLPLTTPTTCFFWCEKGEDFNDETSDNITTATSTTTTSTSTSNASSMSTSTPPHRISAIEQMSAANMMMNNNAQQQQQQQQQQYVPLSNSNSRLQLSSEDQISPIHHHHIIQQNNTYTSSYHSPLFIYSSSSSAAAAYQPTSSSNISYSHYANNAAATSTSTSTSTINPVYPSVKNSNNNSTSHHHHHLHHHHYPLLDDFDNVNSIYDKVGAEDLDINDLSFLSSFMSEKDAKQIFGSC